MKPCAVIPARTLPSLIIKNENGQSELALDFSLLGFEAGNNCKLETVISFDQTVAVSAHVLLLQWLKAHYSFIFKP